MVGHDFVALFAQIAVMLVMAVLMGEVAERLRIPPVIGELIGGILLGPAVFGSVFPEFYQSLFSYSAGAIAGREVIIKFGMLFFLFVAGLEVNPSLLKDKGHAAGWTSLFGVAVPFGVGVLSVFLFPDFWAPYIQTEFWAFALFLGTALSISALPVIARILMDLRLIKNDFGAIVLTAAMVDDLIGWSFFAVLLNYMSSGHFTFFSFLTSLFSVGVFIVLAFFLRRSGRGARILEWLEQFFVRSGGVIGATLVVVLLAAVLVEKLKLHAIFGAFLAGVAMGGGSKKWSDAHNTLSHFVMSFFAPLYFVSVGLRANFLLHFDFMLVLVILLIACIGKIVGAGMGARWGGLPWSKAWSIGFAMNARGAMEIILASAAFEYGLIGEAVFVALVVMALITSVLSGPVISRLLKAQPA